MLPEKDQDQNGPELQMGAKHLPDELSRLRAIAATGKFEAYDADGRATASPEESAPWTYDARFANGVSHHALLDRERLGAVNNSTVLQW